MQDVGQRWCVCLSSFLLLLWGLDFAPARPGFRLCLGFGLGFGLGLRLRLRLARHKISSPDTPVATLRKAVDYIGITFGSCKTNSFHKHAQPSLSKFELSVVLSSPAKSFTTEAKHTHYSKTIAAICLLSSAALALFSHKPDLPKQPHEFGNVEVLQGCHMKLSRHHSRKMKHLIQSN